MKQTLSGGRGWKWVEEEIGSPQGAPAWRQGWVFALHLKLSEVSMGEERGKDIAGEPSAPGREMRIPKAESVHQLFFFFPSCFFSPWKETSGPVWFTHVIHLLPG